MLKAMPYYGGKARHRLNAWLQSLLPTGPRLYLEPSGHGTEFDELGWTRHEFPSNTRPIARSTKARARTEVLWTNY